MTGKRYLLPILAMALAGSQAGHLIAYQLRFGDAAQTIQSSGAHAYFPALVKTGLGAAALTLIGALLLLGFARVSTGRRIETESAPSLLRLLAIVYTLQLVFFGVQESAEAMLTGSQTMSATDLVLWGTAGQLPVALVAALALRWLLVRVGPALAYLKARYAATFQLLPYTPAVVLVPVTAQATLSSSWLARSPNPRGPPSS